VFHQYHQWTQPIAHHHFQPLLIIVKPKLQPKFKKPTTCKKTKKIQGKAWRLTIQLEEV
jgi:hypothetical protein